MEPSSEIFHFSNPQKYLEELTEIETIDEKYYNKWIQEHQEQPNEENVPTNTPDPDMIKRCFDISKLFHLFDENNIIKENFKSRQKLTSIIELLDTNLYDLTEDKREILILLCGVSNDELLCENILNCIKNYDRLEFSLYKRMMNNLGMEYDSEKITKNTSCPSISHNLFCILTLVKNSLKYYPLSDLKELTKDLVHLIYEPVCSLLVDLISSVLMDVLHLLRGKSEQTLQETETLLEIENAPVKFALRFLAYISVPSLLHVSLLFAIRTIYSTINVNIKLKKPVTARIVYKAAEYVGASDKIDLNKFICVIDIINFIINQIDIPENETVYLTAIINVMENLRKNITIQR